MGVPRARLLADDGFTLVELIVGMVITVIIIGAIGSALVVSFRTTDVTQQRMAESHDAQISSAYLANDVQSAASVHLGPGGNCSGSSTELITFAYASHPAVYSCGTSNGEIRVTRTFGGASVVLAHFAEAAKPTVTCSPNTDCSGAIASVEIAFTEASGYTYTLLGSRRGYSESGGGGSGSPGDITLLSTGAASPLWVQGGAACQDPGTTTACEVDPTALALPVADVASNGWSVAPLWNKLNDRSDATCVSTSTQKKIAQVALSSVGPAGGTPPTIEFRAASTGTGGSKVVIHVYNSLTMQELVASSSKNVNNPGSYDWRLTPAEAAQIADTDYQHLTLGFEMTDKNGILSVCGIALNLNPAGVLTINGSLYVDSTNWDAVSLTGKSTARKLSVAPGDFQILRGGGCSGCSSATVYCPTCASQWQPGSYYPSLPDPLRSLAAPPVPATIGSCSGAACTPGRYPSGLSLTSPTTLGAGIYYIEGDLSLSGSASVTCAAPCSGGLLLYIADGSVSLTGQSSVNLPAMSFGVYKGIVLFQARSNARPIKIAGNAGSGTPIRFDGIIYAPSSIQVTLATGSSTFTAKAVVAQNLKVSSTAIIGP